MNLNEWWAQQLALAAQREQMAIEYQWLATRLRLPKAA